MKFIVGCPVRKRSWILPTWREHVLVASEEAGLEPSFLFVAGSDDLETIDLLSSWDNTQIRVVSEEPREDVRAWSSERYHTMVDLRNILLNSVRTEKPSLFLSLDSDILLNRFALAAGLDAYYSTLACAVGLKTYLSDGGVNHPNFGIWLNKHLRNNFNRYDTQDIIRVDILMAAKLMDERSYSIDYQWHCFGEDLGWSSAVADNEGIMFFDGRYGNKHVMHRDSLNIVDERVGF